MITPSDTEQHLLALKELLSDKTRWTQGTSARDARGAPAPVLSDEAVCYCLLGGARKVADMGEAFDRLVSTLVYSSRELFDMVDVAVNDDLGHDAVMQVIEHALEYERRKQPTLTD